MGMGKLSVLILAGCFIFFCIGCSAGNITEPPASPVHQPALNPGHNLLGLFDLVIDSKAYSVDVIPKRLASPHFNVTPMLMDPFVCPELNCIVVQITDIDFSTDIYTINVTLRNPTALTGLDIRGIVFLSPTHYHDLVNFDAYTTVFGEGKFNPFIAFAKGLEARQFSPQAVHSEEFKIWIPVQPNPYAIGYAVTASWPDNCRDPYDITEQEQVGGLFNETGSTCIIRCRVDDWQDPMDMQSVVVDGEAISGLAQLMSYNIEYGKWECTLENQMSAPPGEYILPVTAIANDSVYQTKDFITVTVQDAGPGENSVTGTVEAYSGGGPMPGIFCFTTDGENIYSDYSGEDGKYELKHVPNGGRVICFTGIGTLAQFHEVKLTGTGAVVDAVMPLVFLYVSGPPSFVLNDPEVNVPEMEAVISGAAEDLQDNDKVILIVDGEESLYDTGEYGAFKMTVPLHVGMNKIRLRACNAKGYVFSEWIEIEI